MKNTKVKGFTLIELIVVIAIIAVLAALLIPNLMGWVAKASLKTANSNAKAVATNAMAVISDLETDGMYFSSGTVSGSVAPAASAEYIKQEVERLGGFKDANVWTFTYDSSSGKITDAKWAENDKSEYVGTYPTPAKTKTEGGLKVSE